jgi:hypothetical protein
VGRAGKPRAKCGYLDKLDGKEDRSCHDTQPASGRQLEWEWAKEPAIELLWRWTFGLSSFVSKLAQKRSDGFAPLEVSEPNRLPMSCPSIAFRRMPPNDASAISAAGMITLREL